MSGRNGISHLVTIAYPYERSLSYLNIRARSAPPAESTTPGTTSDSLLHTALPSYFL